MASDYLRVEAREFSISIVSCLSESPQSYLFRILFNVTSSYNKLSAPFKSVTAVKLQLSKQRIWKMKHILMQESTLVYISMVKDGFE